MPPSAGQCGSYNQIHRSELISLWANSLNGSTAVDPNNPSTFPPISWSSSQHTNSFIPSTPHKPSIHVSNFPLKSGSALANLTSVIVMQTPPHHTMSSQSHPLSILAVLRAPKRFTGTSDGGLSFRLQNSNNGGYQLMSMETGSVLT